MVCIDGELMQYLMSEPGIIVFPQEKIVKNPHRCAIIVRGNPFI
jgi:hypothetical protein